MRQARAPWQSVQGGPPRRALVERIDERMGEGPTARRPFVFLLPDGREKTVHAHTFEEAKGYVDAMCGGGAYPAL